MKKSHAVIAYLLFITLSFSSHILAQETSNKLRFELDRINPYISLNKKEIRSAQSISDLNPHYKPSWVKQYIEVEISTYNQGKLQITKSKNNLLTATQKSKLLKSDEASPITVKVIYLPNNNLKYNEPKETSFTFIPEPEKEAHFMGGQQKLTTYINTQIINNIPQDDFLPNTLAAATFMIDEEGKIVDVRLFESSKNEKLDQLILRSIQNMPNWEPATYENGLPVKQEFALAIGNLESCTMNLLNIRRK